MGLGKTITMISLMADDKEGTIDHDEDDDDDGPPVKGKCKFKIVYIAKYLHKITPVAQRGRQRPRLSTC